MNIGDIWIVEAGISPQHDAKFAGAFETKEDAIAFADTLAATLYPNVTIKQETNTWSEGVQYYHPDSYAGSNMFILVSPNKETESSGVIDFFKGIEEIRRKNK